MSGSQAERREVHAAALKQVVSEPGDWQTSPCMPAEGRRWLSQWQMSWQSSPPRIEKIIMKYSTPGVLSCPRSSHSDTARPTAALELCIPISSAVAPLNASSRHHYTVMQLRKALSVKSTLRASKSCLWGMPSCCSVSGNSACNIVPVMIRLS